MINLYYKKDNTLIGPITVAQRDFLVDNLEEDTLDDQDYYIDGPTLDFLQGRGIDEELLAMLTKALGDRSGVTVQWRQE